MRGQRQWRSCCLIRSIFTISALASTLEALVVGPKHGFPIPTCVRVTRRGSESSTRSVLHGGGGLSIHPPPFFARRPFVANSSYRSIEEKGGRGDARGGVDGPSTTSRGSSSPEDEVGTNTTNPTTPQQDRDDPLFVHHVAIQTANITRSIDFYSLFGYEVSCRFRAGPARAAWLEMGCGQRRRTGHAGSAVDSDSAPPPAGGGRLELIEVPAYLFGASAAAPSSNSNGTGPPAPPGRPFRAIDAFSRPTYLGYHHVALDVTSQVRSPPQSASRSLEEGRRAGIGGGGLASWIDHLNATSVRRFGKSVRVALPPKQQIIGTSVYELAFVYDDSGCLVELLNRVSDRKRPIDSGWEPWDGKGFSGVTGTTS